MSAASQLTNRDGVLRQLVPWLVVAPVIALASACGDVVASSDAGTECAVTCSTNAACQQLSCVCNDGFTGDGETCEDIDECATDNGGCDADARCTNTDGSRECECNPAFFGDGLTCEPAWALIASETNIDIDPENFGTKAVGAGFQLFFGPRANDPTNRFMRSLNVTNQVFAGPHALPPGPQTDFCACGFGSIFESNGTTLYLLGNDGFRYDPAVNSWTSIPNYIAVRRGESGGAFDSVSNAIFMVGGRDTMFDALRLDLPAETFSIEGGTLPVPMDEAAAHVLGAGSPVYIAGGNPTALVSHVPGTSEFTTLAAPPDGIVELGHQGDLLWGYTRSGFVAVYDPTLNQWGTRQIPTPLGTRAVVTVAGVAYALVKQGTTVEIHELQSVDHIEF